MYPHVSRRGPLRAGELAEAVVLADLTLVLSIASQVIPLGGALLVIAVVPMAAVAARNRLRAVIAGTVAASAVGFLVLGTPVVTSVVACGALGAVVGIGARRGYGLVRTVGIAALFLWPRRRDLDRSPALDLLLVPRAGSRAAPEQLERGRARASRNLHFDVFVADRGDQIIANVLHYWWLTMPARAARVGGRGVGARAADHRAHAATGARRVRARRRRIDTAARRARRTPTRTGRGRSRSDRCAAVGYRYPQGERRAPRRVARDPAGGDGRDRRAERIGEVDARARARGPAADRGRGHPARSEPGSVLRAVPRSCSNVPSSRCSVCGCETTWCGDCPRTPRSTSTRCSTASGLGSFAERETSTLSGGELQRLAVAAALARRPAAPDLRRVHGDGRRSGPRATARAAALARDATTAWPSCT